MLTHYFKILFRNIYKRKLYSIINILGLAIGLASFILIMLFVLDELSYDKYHSKSDKIYRLNMIYDFEGVGENSASQPFPVAFTIKQEFPHLIEEVTRVFNFQSTRNLVEYEDVKFNEKAFFFADSTFFRIFDYKVIKGDLKTALDEPYSVVMTRSAARRYFGAEDALGKTLKFEQRILLKVTAIIEDVPAQSHFGFDFIASLSSVRKIYGGRLPETWVWNPCWTYLLFHPSVEPDQLESQFEGFVSKYFFDAQKESITLYLQDLKRIHLHSRLDYEIEPNSNYTYIIILILIAAFLLIIACINFMNLATATSANRAREIGIRKVTGAYRGQLILQFIGESIILSLFSMILALILVEVALPYFNDFTGKTFNLSLLLQFKYLMSLIGLWLFIGVLSGTYPAFFLSAFKPISVLKGTVKNEMRSGTARKILVITQFTIAISFAVGTMFIFHQIRQLYNADLGFNKGDIIVIHINRTAITSQYDTFKGEILSDPNIISVSAMDDIIGAAHNTHEFRPEGVPEDKWRFYPALVIKEDFLKTFDIDIVAGRDYNPDSKNDPVSGMLINESMVKFMGWKSNEEALGKKFRSLNGEERIIGVFKDFYATSLHESATPFVLNMKEAPAEIRYFLNYLVVRTGEGKIDETIRFLNLKWNEFEDFRPFEYFFLEDELEDLYADERNLGILSLIFTLLILFIAGLGLFGLASFMAEKRTKEISIRKVMGATFANIFILLSKEFARLIIISMIIAWPLSYFLIDEFFLDQFIIQPGFNFWIPLLAGLFSLLLAMIITMYRAITASLADPAKNLKYE